jgi:hypothetical protein
MFKDLIDRDDVTMLFFDARGHGKSEGDFFKTMGSYGKNEYKDVVGGLNYLMNLSNPETPIMLHKEGVFAHYPIKGFVFDSGFSAVTQMIDVSGMHLQTKVLPGSLRSTYPGKSNAEIQQTWRYKI